jgi:hypothetical protein
MVRNVGLNLQLQLQLLKRVHMDVIVAQYKAFSGKLQCALSSNKCPAQRKKNSKGLSKAQGS